jgi:hypothetical protein
MRVIVAFFAAYKSTFFTFKNFGIFWHFFDFHLFPILEIEKMPKFFSKNIKKKV